MDDDAQRGEPADDLSDLLSEVWHADRFANNPRTREFLDAGEELLHRGLARDANDPIDAMGDGADDSADAISPRSRAPFDELLAWISRRRVVEKARRLGKKNNDAATPTESAYRYRWRTQTGYLRDLVIYSLRSRLAAPNETNMARDLLFGRGRQSATFDEAIDRIAYSEVAQLLDDKAFRLQMIFQATLAHDAHVANALQRVDRTNITAWRDFYAEALEKLGLRLRPGLTVDDLAQALQASAEGVVFRALLPPGTPAIDRENQASQLSTIAMAILVAFVDPGDGRELRQVVRDISGHASADHGAAENSRDQ